MSSTSTSNPPNGLTLSTLSHTKANSNAKSPSHRRCGTLKTTKPIVFDAISSRELPLDAFLTFPIDWNSYLQVSGKVSKPGNSRVRPNLSPLQRVAKQSSSPSSINSAASSSSSSSLSTSSFSSLPSSSTSTSSLRISSNRDDRPPRAKKQFIAPLPSSPEDCGCGQLLGTSENNQIEDGSDLSALGLVNLDLALEESEESSCPPTPALSDDNDSTTSTPRSAASPMFLSSPKISFRTVDYKLKAEEEIIKLNQPLISPFSEEPPTTQEEGNRWREWEKMCIESSAMGVDSSSPSC